MYDVDPDRSVSLYPLVLQAVWIRLGARESWRIRCDVSVYIEYVFGSRNSDPQYLGATCCHPGAFQEELPSVPTSSTDCRGRCYIDHPAPKCLSRHNVAVALKGGRVTSASKPLISPRELDRHVPGHFDVHSLENIQHTRVPTLFAHMHECHVRKRFVKSSTMVTMTLYCQVTAVLVYCAGRMGHLVIRVWVGRTGSRKRSTSCCQLPSPPNPAKSNFPGSILSMLLHLQLQGISGVSPPLNNAERTWYFH